MAVLSLADNDYGQNQLADCVPECVVRNFLQRWYMYSMADIEGKIRAYFKRDPGFWKFLGWVIGLSTLLFFAYQMSAEASHNPKYCQDQSNAIFVMADARDDGLPARAFLRVANGLSPELKAKYLELIKMAYTNRDVFPERLGAIVYNNCMSHD